MKLEQIRELTASEVELICDALQHYDDYVTLDDSGRSLANILRGNTIEVSE